MYPQVAMGVTVPQGGVRAGAIEVVVPSGAFEGTPFAFRTPDGATQQMATPTGAQPGDAVRISSPE